MDKQANQESNQNRKDHSDELKNRNEKDYERILKEKKVYTEVDEEINKLVEIYKGSIVEINNRRNSEKIDSIVNAANETLLGGGGIDQIIHAKAGPGLREECIKKFPEDSFGARCRTGYSVITGAHNLPFKAIIHTVGPYLDDSGNPQPKLLEFCYKHSLMYLDGKDISSIAFPCISTGYYGYPMVDACEIALGYTRKFLDDPDNRKNTKKILFCVYNDLEFKIYQNLFDKFFPKKKI
ncbi:poly [adp-ribose] polymerase [Anaeramoeba ignava]|uniref:Poly [adp-ribose] polymerase n=1 Tax=Anaeramoeba ignava TaxID=1746090 RepID=A0A9Q0LL14_ANAIG|nr:poly [adp-ribose] polymerase [Anaeramoeba ignava]